MKKTIKNLETKAVKNVNAVKGGESDTILKSGGQAKLNVVKE